jgi:hypothetical protein
LAVAAVEVPRSGRKKTQFSELGAAARLPDIWLELAAPGFPKDCDNDDAGEVDGAGNNQIVLGFPYSRAFTSSAINRLNVDIKQLKNRPWKT